MYDYEIFPAEWLCCDIINPRRAHAPEGYGSWSVCVCLFVTTLAVASFNST